MRALITDISCSWQYPLMDYTFDALIWEGFWSASLSADKLLSCLSLRFIACRALSSLIFRFIQSTSLLRFQSCKKWVYQYIFYNSMLVSYQVIYSILTTPVSSIDVYSQLIICPLEPRPDDFFLQHKFS